VISRLDKEINSQLDKEAKKKNWHTNNTNFSAIFDDFKSAEKLNKSKHIRFTVD
jgi:hypothetical protein